MSKLRSALISVLILAIGFGIGGCGKSVSGTYSDDKNTVSIEFKSGGKAYVKTMGGTQEADYTLDGDKVTLKIMGQSPVLTIKDDGSLDGGEEMGILKKK